VSGKRLFDLTIAALALAVLALPMLVLAFAVWARLGRPVLFIQPRAGLHGRPFNLVKFRSMREAVDPEGNPLPDEERLTRFGRFLRASSLDELPELWNVFKGDMSLVGPRPLLMEYLPLYTPEQMRRHEVRPGITGWAQVRGRNALSWEERFRLDVWYVDNKTFAMDLKILCLTLCRVVVQDGIAHPGHVTMQKFIGSDSRKIGVRHAARERYPE
jgi:lipopolysaccharide/colanic/teichoic acid biosynthesis glycosyltransferase